MKNLPPLSMTWNRTGSYQKQYPHEWQKGVPGMELVVDAGSSFDPDSHFLFWKPDSPAKA